jgi:hypothetical protein
MNSQANQQGLYISLLGIDGIGKTSLARHLASALREGGAVVREVSWRSALDADLPAWPREALRTLWIDTFRLLVGGARTPAGEFISIPESYEAWREGKVEDSLGDAQRSASAPSGPLAAFLVELAGNVVLYSDVIRPAVERGEVVIQETFPYKHVLKEYLLALELANRSSTGGYHRQHIQSLFAPVAQFFGQVMRPDVGMLLDGAVELALSWRLRQSGRVGLLEDFRTAGDSGLEGFIRLQRESGRLYREFAERWQWDVHEVTDRSLGENLTSGLHALYARIAELRPEWDLGNTGPAARLDVDGGQKSRPLASK